MFKLKETKERGQVLVESAIVFPLMIFFTLGILQLTMVQQGKIMMDYAAYAAARSGVVHSGEKIPMEAAANIALISFQNRTNDFTSFLGGYIKLVAFKAVTDHVSELADSYSTEGGFLNNMGALALRYGLSFVPDGLYGTWARVFIVSPTTNDFGSAKEIEFDYSNGSKKGSIAGQGDILFANGNTGIANANGISDRTTKDLSILTVAVSYDYELKIAFVNWVMFEAWYATQIGMELSGAIWSARAKVGGFSDATAVGSGTMTRGATRGMMLAKSDKNTKRVYVRARKNLKYYWGQNALSNRYYLPLYGSYSMRMHSNLYKRNVEVKGDNERSNGLPTNDAGL